MKIRLLKHKDHVLLALVVFFCFCFMSCNKSSLNYEVIVADIEIPWEIQVGPNNNLWFTNQDNKVSKINLKTDQIQNLTIQDSTLHPKQTYYFLGLQLHPDFEQKPIVYLSIMYMDLNDSSTAHLDVKMYQYQKQKRQLCFIRTIEDSIGLKGSWSPGGRMAITKDDKLLIVASNMTGEMASFKVSKLAGSILRYNLDGSIPADNPFKKSPIYTLGHRNPQGLEVLPNEEIFISEHGPATDDEINKILPAKNYGWPLVCGYCNKPKEQSTCDSIDIQEPIYAWTPTIAPGGLDYYAHDTIQQFQNSFLVNTLKEGDIRLLQPNDDFTDIIEEKTVIKDAFGRLRDIAIDENGFVYVSTANRLGEDEKGNRVWPGMRGYLKYDVIVRITPSNS